MSFLQLPFLSPPHHQPPTASTGLRYAFIITRLHLSFMHARLRARLDIPRSLVELPQFRVLRYI
jgi:hypothetical protein